MPLTYAQKDIILQHLSRADLWTVEDQTGRLLQAQAERLSRSKEDRRIVYGEKKQIHDKPAQTSPLWSSHLNCRLRFPCSNHFRNTELINGIKLIVARDLGIEPALQGPNMRQGGGAPIVQAQIMAPWLLTTAFRGHALNIPRRFAVEAGSSNQDQVPDSFVLCTDKHTMRDILAKTTLWQTVRHAGIPDISPSSAIETYKIARLLQQTPTISLQGGEWHMLTLSGSAQNIVEILFRKSRSLFAERIAAPAETFCVLNYDPQRTLLAVRSDVLAQALCAWDATKKTMQAITSGQYNGLSADQFIAQIKESGADLRYEDPSAARRGASLARMMMDYGRYELLSAWKRVESVEHLRHKLPLQP